MSLICIFSCPSGVVSLAMILLMSGGCLGGRGRGEGNSCLHKRVAVRLQEVQSKGIFLHLLESFFVLIVLGDGDKNAELTQGFGTHELLGGDEKNVFARCPAAHIHTFSHCPLRVLSDACTNNGIIARGIKLLAIPLRSWAITATHRHTDTHREVL